MFDFVAIRVLNPFTGICFILLVDKPSKIFEIVIQEPVFEHPVMAHDK